MLRQRLLGATAIDGEPNRLLQKVGVDFVTAEPLRRAKRRPRDFVRPRQHDDWRRESSLVRVFENRRTVEISESHVKQADVMAAGIQFVQRGQIVRRPSDHIPSPVDS